MSLPPPTDELLARAAETCRAFVAAILWGEHHRIWELLAPEGRKTVLRVGTSRGLDEALGMRLREGRATEAEMVEFLADLVNGLRADLAGNDLERLEYTVDPAPAEPGRVRVVMSVPLPEPLARGRGGLPVGWFDLSSDERGEWRIDRLVPRPPGG